MKSIWELEKSDDVLNRQKYAERIKLEFIPKIQERIVRLEKEDGVEYELELEKRFLKNLKIRLANYDIYKQTMPCQMCGEVVCICYEADRSFEEEIKTLF